MYKRQYQSSIAGLSGKLTELESLDELNYLSELLKMQFDDDRAKFVAAMEYLSLIHLSLSRRSFFRRGKPCTMA